MIKEKGFTLIELLIAVSILSALLFTGTYTYQMLATRWDKEIGHYQYTVDMARNIQLLKGVLTGINAYVVLEYNSRPPVPGILFVGYSERLLAITQQGLFSDHYPEIFRLVLEPQENQTYNLIYQAASSKNLLLLSAQQNIEFEYSYLLLEGVDSFELSYLGWDNIFDKSEKSTTGASPTWRDNFSGVNSQMLPNEIKAKIQFSGQSIEFWADVERNSLRFISPYLSASHDTQ